MKHSQALNDTDKTESDDMSWIKNVLQSFTDILIGFANYFVTLFSVRIAFPEYSPSPI